MDDSMDIITMIEFFFYGMIPVCLAYLVWDIWYMTRRRKD
jgi:hypothetical protein